jgi:electron transport complex protein RnfG
MKNYLKVAGILGAITLICAVLIGLMNMLTSPIIKKNEEETIQNTYARIYEEYSYNEEVEFKDSTGYIVSKVEAFDSNGNSLGYIYTTSGKNAYGEVSLMIGIRNLEVYDVEFLTNTESFASTVNSHVKENYPSSSEDIIEINPYGSEDTIDVGALDSDALSAIDTSCGATYGATLVKNMVSAALDEAKGVA